MCFLHSAQIVGVPFSRLAFVRKRQCLRSCVFRLGMCTQNKQTDLQLRNACAKWECCASSAFQGDSHQAFEVPWYELSSVCLSLNFDGMSQSCCRVSSVSTQCHLNDKNPGKKTLTTYSNVDFFHYHHYVATKFQKREQVIPKQSLFPYMPSVLLVAAVWHVGDRCLYFPSWNPQSVYLGFHTQTTSTIPLPLHPI